jgi:type VI secretion system secreted protein VgrG
MADYGQYRSVSLAGPGDMQQLMITRLSAVEQISRPFQCELELCGMEGAALEGTIDPDGILGKPACVTLKTYDGRARYFHGIVTEFAHTGSNERYCEYRAVLRPEFWLLTRRSDCRVWQAKTTVDIVQDVFTQAGLEQPKTMVGDRYEPWDYRVQYGETDFDFVSRLLEHEGIFYYFVHTSDSHQMVLTDDVGRLDSPSGYESVPYFPPGGSGVHRLRDHLNSWMVSKTFQPAAFATRDYDFEAPSALVSGVSPVANRTDTDRFEIFEYPAGAVKRDSSGADRMAKLRAQQAQAAQSNVRAKGDAVGLSAGRVFTLKEHPREDFNKKYLITRSVCTVVSDSARTGAGANADAQCEIEIEAIDAQEPFRPARITPKPRIQGPQTAFVVGPANEEFCTDKYGRVKVQFHWDRVGTGDDQSSCWVRVAQAWAGRNWGTQFIPRVGDEVVVSFIDGDPDHPLIIGSVYNAEYMPPYALPANQTQSGVKTRSSKNGTAENFNEIRFEDKKDAEEIYIHAERDLNVVVENNQTISIGAEKKDEGNRTVTIHNNDALSVGNDLEVKVTGKETRKVSKDRTTTIEGNEALESKKKLSLKAFEAITLEVGQSKLVMKNDGTIELTGMQLKIKGDAKIEIDGTQLALSGKMLDVKGTKTAVEGSGMLDLTSSGIASLKGSITKLG